MVHLLHLSTQFTCKVGTTSTLRISAELEPSAFDEKSVGVSGNKVVGVRGVL